MATLVEIAQAYREAAARLRVAIELADSADSHVTARDLTLMRQMLREMRELRQVCESYYTAARDGRYTSSEWRAGRQNALR